MLQSLESIVVEHEALWQVFGVFLHPRLLLPWPVVELDLPSFGWLHRVDFIRRPSRSPCDWPRDRLNDSWTLLLGWSSAGTTLLRAASSKKGAQNGPHRSAQLSIESENARARTVD